MPKIKIVGGKRLSGEVIISGAKNSAVALIPASILCDEDVFLDNVPNISDIDDLEDILSFLGVKLDRGNDFLSIDASGMSNNTIPSRLSSRLRASYYFMGALLGKYGYVDMCFPGGCSIGERPIMMHLKAFEKLGANVGVKDDRFFIKADKLVGSEIFLDFPSVGATINVILAAVRAEGVTVIDNAAKEPHVIDLCNFLNNMGAKIKGTGTGRIEITGVNYLHSVRYSVVPDMIEAGTYVIIGCLLGNNLKVSKIDPIHIESLITKLEEAGCNLVVGSDYIVCNGSNNYRAIDIKTMAYPGFPTDLQQIMVPFLVSCNGISHIEETIWENRFQNIKDTVKMGACIEVSSDNRVATIYGHSSLVGKNVSATDLRGGASMVVCGLIASGVTVIDNIEYILRGYEDIVSKLSNIGADIKIVD